ncbi:hypothetical protein ACFQ9X_34235 [Catenulispora yoronensis]
MQSTLDGEREVRDALRVARGQHVPQHIGGRCPLGHFEHRCPQVGPQSAGGLAHGEHEFARLGTAVQLGESSVAQVKGAVSPSQIAEDIWSLLAFEKLLEIAETPLQRTVVQRIEGHELSAGSARGVLAVLGVDDRRAAQEFERQPSLKAVGVHYGKDLLGVVQAGGHVDLPALFRQTLLLRLKDDPHLSDIPHPSRR